MARTPLTLCAPGISTLVVQLDHRECAEERQSGPQTFDCTEIAHRNIVETPFKIKRLHRG